MHTDQYTADIICRSMGLLGFFEESWSTSATAVLRLLLKPSFDPEVCITLSSFGSSANLCVIALSEMLWRQPGPCRLAEHREEVVVDPNILNDMVTNILAAHAESCAQGRFVCLDGMGSECCYVRAGHVLRFVQHVSRPSIVQLVVRVIDLAWQSCHDPFVKNALVRCAKYVDMDYALETEPVAPRVTRLLVLGSPDDRAEYLDLIRRRGRG